MPELVQHILRYLPFAAAAGILGGVVAVVKPPPDKYRSYIQHFAAGLLLAIIAVDILPEVRREGDPGLVLAGFGIGSALMIGVKWLSDKMEDASHKKLPYGLATVAALDTAVDGMIIGIGFAAAAELGALLAVALGIELFVLTLSVAAEYARVGASKLRIVLTTIGISMMLLLGAVGAAWLLGDLPLTILAIILAFAAAALTYLATEELLIKGHRAANSPGTVAAFFAGFMALMAWTLLGPQLP